MEVYQHPKLGDFNEQLQVLEAAIAGIDLRNEEMEKALTEQLTLLSALEVEYDARMALLHQRSSQDIQPLVDRLQSTMLQDLDADRRLCQDIATLWQSSGPLEDNITSLFRRVGEVMGLQGTANVQSHVLPMPDWSVGGPSNFGT
jgi:hypothetical protein